MNKVSDGNFWECYVPQAKAGQMYKYKIYDRNSNPVDHCDPYGFGMELRPSSASIIRDMSKYKFKDSQWLQNRSDCRKTVEHLRNSFWFFFASLPTKQMTGITMKK